MKRTKELINEVVAMGFSYDEALSGVDASLDYSLGFENRKPIDDELITEDLYDEIIDGFICALITEEVEACFIEGYYNKY